MKIGGLQKVSLIDFPAQIAAIVFVKGCNFRCPFCFNRDLVLGNLPTISQRTVLNFLAKRKKVLDGVVVSGGEPLLQPDLENFLHELKQLGFLVKLDTNGSLPKGLVKILKKNLLDYVALDFKAPLDGRFGKVVGVVDFNHEIWLASFKFLLKSLIPFELRTTIVPGIHNQKVLVEMAGQIKKAAGNKSVKWYWQNFRPQNCLDPTFEEIKPLKREQLEAFLKAVKRYFASVELRNY